MRITTNCGQFWKRWAYQTTLPASWETCMQAPLPNKISCFFSTCVSSDNSFLSIRQEPTYFFMVLPLFPNLALVHCGWRKPTCPVVFWLRHVRKYYTLVQFRDSNRITCFSWPLSLHLLCNVRTAWLIVFIF